MAANANLHKAKDAKNDEFYTQLTDVSKELMHYKQHFKDKIVLCNCDDPTWSAFWKYFHLNFSALGLKKLISTHYDKTQPTYKMEYTGGDDNDIEVGVKTPLEGNGDFRNQECLDLLDEADIVVTNPPFSLFREYVAVLMEHEKKFIIIGNMNAVTYKDFFALLKDNKVWVGANEKGGTRKGNSLCFTVPDGYDGKTVDVDGTPMVQVSAWWYTNLDFAKRHEKMILWKEYNSTEYPTYDNYDAIECGHSDQIPADYDGIIGVPISFLNGFYCPEQFEVLGIANGCGDFDDKPLKRYQNAKQHALKNGKWVITNGSKANTRACIRINPSNDVYYTADNIDYNIKSLYARILIRKKVGA